VARSRRLRDVTERYESRTWRHSPWFPAATAEADKPARRHGRITLLDLELLLPARSGATRCHVTATALSDGGLPVVLVTDSSANPGISVHLVFSHVVTATRRLLPSGGEEPIWIHRWEERALASVVLHDKRVSRDHLMQLSADGWEEWPIPGSLTKALLG
jgi:hypothetical protein